MFVFVPQRHAVHDELHVRSIPSASWRDNSDNPTRDPMKLGRLTPKAPKLLEKRSNKAESLLKESSPVTQSRAGDHLSLALDDFQERLPACDWWPLLGIAQRFFEGCPLEDQSLPQFYRKEGEYVVPAERRNKLEECARLPP